MTQQLAQSDKERILAEQLIYGNLFAAAPGLRALADLARTEHDSGLMERDIRQRIRSRLESEGLTSRKMLLPNISRKMLRVKLRPLLHALADLIVDKAPTNRFGLSLDHLLAKIGYDQWLEDFVFTYATTGEVLPIFGAYAGTVHRHEFGPEGDKSPTFWLVATSASDLQALLEWFKEEVRAAFPDETFTKRHGKAFEGVQDGVRSFKALGARPPREAALELRCECEAVCGADHVCGGVA